MKHTLGMWPRRSKRVELHGALAFPERGPGEQRQAEVDDGRVQGADGPFQLNPEGLGRVQAPGGGDQPLGKVGVDPPVAHLVGMGQRVAGDDAPEAQVVELGLSHPEAGLDIPEALPVRELGEGQAEEPILAGEGFDLVLAPGSGPHRHGTRTGR